MLQTEGFFETKESLRVPPQYSVLYSGEVMLGYCEWGKCTATPLCRLPRAQPTWGRLLGSSGVSVGLLRSLRSGQKDVGTRGDGLSLIR